MKSFTMSNGLFIENAETRWGWVIKSVNDLLLALEGMSYFAYVDSYILEERINECIQNKKKYKSVNDFASYLANYI